MEDQMTHAEAVSRLVELSDENERLRAALESIWDKYVVGGSKTEPTTALSGTLAYMAKDALQP